MLERSVRYEALLEGALENAPLLIVGDGPVVVFEQPPPPSEFDDDDLVEVFTPRPLFGVPVHSLGELMLVNEIADRIIPAKFAGTDDTLRNLYGHEIRHHEAALALGVPEEAISVDYLLFRMRYGDGQGRPDSVGFSAGVTLQVPTLPRLKRALISAYPEVPSNDDVGMYTSMGYPTRELLAKRATERGYPVPR